MRYIRCFFKETLDKEGNTLKYRQAFFNENRLTWFEQTEKNFYYVFSDERVELIHAVGGYVTIDGWEKPVLVESIRGIPKFYEFEHAYPLSTDDWRENPDEQLAAY